jgi:tetratricopeptide (TPR) repeat protein
MMRHGVLGLLIVLAMAAGSSRAMAEVDGREMRAREAFGAGRYQEALDGFVKLYAEKLHPNYLRNIGRCYQNLGDPDKAISSFREYLRKAKAVGGEERKEVEGYIKEMEDLKRQREAAAVAPPPPLQPPTTAPATTALPAAEPPPPPRQPSLTLTQPAAEPAREEEAPVYKKWWFWTLIGGAVVGGIGVAAAAGVFTKTQDASCMAPLMCKG